MSSSLPFPQLLNDRGIAIPHVLFSLSAPFRLQPYKLSACSDTLPDGAAHQTSRWETGTANFAIIEGVRTAIHYMASLGARCGRVGVDEPLRRKLEGAFEAVEMHEQRICASFLERIREISKLKIFGIVEKITEEIGDEKIDENGNNNNNNAITRRLRRTPTFALQMSGMSAASLAQALVDRGVICGAGHFYAINFPRIVGVDAFARIGFFHYNTLEEVHRVADALGAIAREGK